MDNRELQQENRAKARELMDAWLDCYVNADTENKNYLGNDFVDLLTKKIPNRDELRFRMAQLEAIEDSIRDWIG